MRLEGRRESDNVIDGRRSSPRGLMVGGGGLLTVVVILLAMFFNVDPKPLLQNMPQPGGAAVGQAEPIDPANDPQAELVSFCKKILADTEDTWEELFATQVGKAYQPAPLHLFSGAVRSACGGASSAMGPFYCPGDQTVYLDLDFFEEMKTKFEAPGDFAMAYVIAHEVGHHVQNLLGLSMKVQQLQSVAKSRGDETESNRLSVRLELQADFLAGVWAHHAEKRQPFLEKGDVAEALNAARQIGDDKLQKRSTGTVMPDAFTHGSSEQRIRWFSAGLRSGNFEDLEKLFNTPYDQL
jgi:predicted metalloprotease